EVSDGTIDLPPAVRRDLIRRARDMGFGVLAEMGKKDSGRALVPEEVWEQAAADRAAGAELVIVEGRDSGRGVGIYDAGGQIREPLLEAAAAGVGGADGGVWEVALTHQEQAGRLRAGPVVNVGKVQPAEALAVEAMRSGLRGDALRRCLAGVGEPGVPA